MQNSISNLLSRNAINMYTEQINTKKNQILKIQRQSNMPIHMPICPRHTQNNLLMINVI